MQVRELIRDTMATIRKQKVVRRKTRGASFELQMDTTIQNLTVGSKMKNSVLLSGSPKVEEVPYKKKDLGVKKMNEIVADVEWARERIFGRIQMPDNSSCVSKKKRKRGNKNNSILTGNPSMNETLHLSSNKSNSPTMKKSTGVHNSFMNLREIEGFSSQNNNSQL